MGEKRVLDDKGILKGPSAPRPIRRNWSSKYVETPLSKITGRGYEPEFRSCQMVILVVELVKDARDDVL